MGGENPLPCFLMIFYKRKKNSWEERLFLKNCCLRCEKKWECGGGEFPQKIPFYDERVNKSGEKFGGAQNIYKKAKIYITEHSEK